MEINQKVIKKSLVIWGCFCTVMGVETRLERFIKDISG